jgi:hypothetical protein
LTLFERAVSRTSRSANSFGLALFEGKGELGACKFKPFYVYSASENEDRQLRFFATCPKYTSDVRELKTASVRNTAQLNPHNRFWEIKRHMMRPRNGSISVDPLLQNP